MKGFSGIVHPEGGEGSEKSQPLSNGFCLGVAGLLMMSLCTGVAICMACLSHRPADPEEMSMASESSPCVRSRLANQLVVKPTVSSLDFVFVEMACARITAKQDDMKKIDGQQKSIREKQIDAVGMNLPH